MRVNRFVTSLHALSLYISLSLSVCLIGVHKSNKVLGAVSKVLIIAIVANNTAYMLYTSI